MYGCWRSVRASFFSSHGPINHGQCGHLWEQNRVHEHEQDVLMASIIHVRIRNPLCKIRHIYHLFWAKILGGLLSEYSDLPSKCLTSGIGLGSREENGQSTALCPPVQAERSCTMGSDTPNINQGYPARVIVTTDGKQAIITLLWNISFVCVCVNYKYYFFSPPSVFKMWFHISFNVKWFIT